MQCGQQNVHTPFDICRKMIGKLAEYTILQDKEIAVLFNIEFLHVLIRDYKIPSKNITIFVDDEREFEFCKFYGMIPDVNLFYIDTEKTIKENGLYTTKGKVMKRFNCIIMNPPYQIEDGGHARSSKPLYHRFIEKIIDEIQPDYLVSINPSRWMVGGKGLDAFRQKMMNDRRIKIIVDDMTPSGIFSNVDIAGGVNYFVWDKSYNGKCSFNGIERFLDEEDIILRENESRSIIKKVKNITNVWIGTNASPSKPYGLRGDATICNEGMPCWFKQSIGLAFVKPSSVKNSRNDLHLWKVLVPRAPIAGQTDFTKPIAFFNDNNVIIAKPGECCTETYIVLKTLKSEKEAKYFVSYLRTIFFRFMLRIRVVSQDITRETYNWVPDLEDYSKPWTDKELYEKFGLNEEEQAYIESKIKELK